MKETTYVWPVFREECGCIFQDLGNNRLRLIKACDEHREAYLENVGYQS